MKDRRIRERQYRRIFVAGIGVSVAAHAVVLGVSAFKVPAKTAGPAETNRRAESEEVEFHAIELVELSVQAEPTEAPAPVEAVVAAAAVEPSAEAPAAAPPGSAPAPPSPAAGAPSPMANAAAILASLEAPSAPSMRANFAVQRSLPYGASASQPIPERPYADPHAGHDHSHDEESDGNGWWGRFKVALGQGATGGYCKPRKPPVLVSGPNQPPVLGEAQPEDDTQPPDAQFPRPRGPRGRILR